MIEGIIDGELYTTILGHELMKTIDQCGKNPSDTVSSRTVTPSTPAKRLGSSPRTVRLRSYHGNYNHQTSTPLSTSSTSSNRGWENTQTPQRDLELWERVDQEWEAIPASVCRNLVESMPRWAAAVIAAKGSCTKY